MCFYFILFSVIGQVFNKKKHNDTFFWFKWKYENVTGCLIYSSPIARCSLWPKHWSLVQLFREAAFTMFAPLSVVMHTIFSSSKLQESRLSFSPCASSSPVWSAGKNAVCRQRLFTLKSLVMKCTVKLKYGSMVRLDHRSVVAAKFCIFCSSFSTVIRHWVYRPGSRAVTITALPLHRGNEMRPRCCGHHRTVFRGTRPNFLQRGNKTR